MLGICCWWPVSKEHKINHVLCRNLVRNRKLLQTLSRQGKWLLTNCSLMHPSPKEKKKRIQNVASFLYCNVWHMLTRCVQGAQNKGLVRNLVIGEKQDIKIMTRKVIPYELLPHSHPPPPPKKKERKVPVSCNVYVHVISAYLAATSFPLYKETMWTKFELVTLTNYL